MTINFKSDDVDVLISTFDKSDWDELHVTGDRFQLHLSKKVPLPRDRYGAAPMASLSSQSAETLVAPVRGESAPPVAVAYAPPQAPEVSESHVAVRAPSLGTFYQAPKPGAAPYVQVGQRVDAETELCVIEVMKLFTTVRAGVSGVVHKVLVTDAQMVEFDQPLFLIEPIA